MHAYMYTHTYIHVYIHMSVYVHTLVCTYACAYMYVYANVYIHVYECMCAYMHIHTYIIEIRNATEKSCSKFYIAEGRIRSRKTKLKKLLKCSTKRQKDLSEILTLRIKQGIKNQVRKINIYLTRTAEQTQTKNFPKI